ncbi:hypothetical protein B0H11DRAFT_2058069 [Mycena galericulata]|nr:hypothetical protein B0H11DRAFT_2058069 [Mycena galericulata]
MRLVSRPRRQNDALRVMWRPKHTLRYARDAQCEDLWWTRAFAGRVWTRTRGGTGFSGSGSGLSDFYPDPDPCPSLMIRCCHAEEEVCHWVGDSQDLRIDSRSMTRCLRPDQLRRLPSYKLSILPITRTYCPARYLCVAPSLPALCDLIVNPFVFSFFRWPSHLKLAEYHGYRLSEFHRLGRNTPTRDVLALEMSPFLRSVGLKTRV